MAITYVNQWAYTNSNTQSFQTDNNQPFCFVGKDNNNNIYYTYVVKLQTSTALLNPTLKLYTAGTDNTSADKWLSAKFVPCTSSETPSSTYIGKAVNGDTRLRFGRIWDGSSWSGSGSNPAEGRTTNVTIPKGYFFIYITHHSSSTYQHSFSTIRVWTATANAPILTGTEGYTVTYNANGGSGSTASQTAAYNSTIQLLSNGFTAPSKAVHTLTLNGNGGKNGTPSFQNNYFSSWRTGASSGTTYAEGADFKVTADTTLYARWGTRYIWGSTTRDSTEANGYTVTYDANGGTCSVKSATVKDVTTYAFQGWGDSASATTVKWNSTSTYQQTDNYTAYAIWKSTVVKGSTSLPTAQYLTGSTFTISFDYQGGSGTTASANSFKIITKTFQGWNTRATATTALIGTYTPTSNVTLYAIWGASTTTYSSISLPTPTKKGYKFVGWATSANATSNIITTGTYTPTSDNVTTLYAIWEANGSIRIYVDGEYKMAMVYVYNGSKWVLALPYLYNGKWILLAG